MEAIRVVTDCPARPIEVTSWEVVIVLFIAPRSLSVGKARSRRNIHISIGKGSSLHARDTSTGPLPRSGQGGSPSNPAELPSLPPLPHHCINNILRAKEGEYVDGKWMPLCIFNGDQTQRGLNFRHKENIIHVTIYRWD
ncbi:MAG: DUF5597 domain-containing protein [Ktedonobacteraceae bacterium]|nr:DUF5597 domain-containing protein [Ktedonobacteraceae bacterium]